MIPSALKLVTHTLKNDKTILNDQFKKLGFLTFYNIRNICITSNLEKEFRVGNVKVRSQTLKNVTSEGKLANQIQQPVHMSQFPDSSTDSTLFDGIPYCQIPIINIKSTVNNTILSVTDYKGKGIITHSAGCEGFKNSKKGTNVAAQQTAFTVGNKALQNGITMVRLRVQGIGPGKAGALKGIQLSGVKVISITDDTRVSWNPPRPRKQRRV